MLAIRLRRAGSKGRPFFRVVVTEAKSPREGRFVEVLGHYDPRTKPETLVVDRDRLAHWIRSGARPSDSVRTLVDRMPPAPVEPVAETGVVSETVGAAEPAEPAEAGTDAAQGAS
jgi:small subunit ribosomal protein S16